MTLLGYHVRVLNNVIYIFVKIVKIEIGLYNVVVGDVMKLYLDLIKIINL